MKVIHTSDWHIGRRFERMSLEADQRAFLRWLAELIEERRVDLLIIAGDVYDRALPAEEAVALLDAGLDMVRAAGAQVVLISGNHDSARRLGFGARRQALGGVHVLADEHSRPVPLRISAGGVEVAILGIPFLDPALVSGVYEEDAEVPRRRTHESVLVGAIEAGRAGLGEISGVPTIAIAHAFVIGAQSSDSEKALSVGGADCVDAAIFAGFDYVALGHLHRSQKIGVETVAYSGSPIPYSYSETSSKSVRLLEISTHGVESIEEIVIPVGRSVATIRGSLNELLTLPEYEPLTGGWICADLTDETAQFQALERLRSRYPFATTVRYRGRTTSMPIGSGEFTSNPEVHPAEDVVLEFLADLRGRSATDAEREVVFGAVSAAMRELSQ